MNVYALPAQEDWICDDLCEDWRNFSNIASLTPRTADIYWMFSDWRWNSIAPADYVGKKVVVTVHHIVPDKFDRGAFDARDKIVDLYHVFNHRTESQIKNYTRKPIVQLPYWANQHRWAQTSRDKREIRREFGLPEDLYLIGSFQRDTEAASLRPGCKFLEKKEKGPREFVDFIVKIFSNRKDIAVVLGGWRRQFIAQQLSERVPNVKVFSFTPEDRLHDSNLEIPRATCLNERPGWGISYSPPRTIKTPLKDALLQQRHLIELYQSLDLYAVTANHEGGPQSLLETGLLGVPVVSRPVGIAEQVLPPSAIDDDVSQATPCVPDVRSMMLPHGMDPYREMFSSLMK